MAPINLNNPGHGILYQGIPKGKKKPSRKAVASPRNLRIPPVLLAAVAVAGVGAYIYVARPPFVEKIVPAILERVVFLRSIPVVGSLLPAPEQPTQVAEVVVSEEDELGSGLRVDEEVEGKKEPLQQRKEEVGTSSPEPAGEITSAPDGTAEEELPVTKEVEEEPGVVAPATDQEEPPIEVAAEEERSAAMGDGDGADKEPIKVTSVRESAGTAGVSRASEIAERQEEIARRADREVEEGVARLLGPGALARPAGMGIDNVRSIDSEAYRADLKGERDLVRVASAAGVPSGGGSEAASAENARAGRGTEDRAASRDVSAQNGSRADVPASALYPFVLHVASFPDRGSAIQKVNDLRQSGFTAFTFLYDIPGKGKWYRVFVDRFGNREEAEGFADRVSKAVPIESAQPLRLPFSVEVGAFDSFQVASDEELRLIRKGMLPYIFAEQAPDGEKVLYRVLLGAFDSRAQAEGHLNILAASGISGRVVQP